MSTKTCGLLSAFTIFVLLYYYYIIKPDYEIYKTEVKPGQVWRLEYKPEDPFEKVFIKNYKVIDVKDGYIQYYDPYSQFSDTSSCSKRDFLMPRKLVK